MLAVTRSQPASSAAACGAAAPDVWALTLEPRPAFGPAARAARGDALDVRCAGTLAERGSLASELGLGGHVSDEVLVGAAFARWGAGAFHRLRGPFLIAVSNRTTGETTIARDQLGIHPCFFAIAQRTCFVGASAQAVLARAGLPKRLNRVALADALCRRFPDPEETFFENVRRLPAGCRAVITRYGAIVERYWDPLPDDGDVIWQDASALEVFPALQRRAVQRCLDPRQDGLFLSGGLDSVSVAAIAADSARVAGHAPLVGLSLVQHDPACNERDIQVAVATRLGLRHVLHDLKPALGAQSLLAQSAQLAAQLSSPQLNVLQPPYLALAAAGRRLGVRTILTGEGGDEWLSASPYGVADLLRQGRMLRALSFAREFGRSEVATSLIRNFGVRPLASAAVSAVAGGAWQASRARRYIANDPAWLGRDRSLREAQLDRANAALGPARPRHGFVAAELNAGLRGALTSWEFEERHDVGRAVDVRFAHPYMDVDLVSHMCRVPAHLLNPGGRLRGLLRQQLTAQFPDLGFDRQVKKLGQDFYRRLVWRDPLLSAIAHERFPALSSLGVVDADRAQAFVLERETHQDPRLRTWDLFNTEIWARAQMQ